MPRSFCQEQKTRCLKGIKEEEEEEEEEERGTHG